MYLILGAYTLRDGRGFCIGEISKERDLINQKTWIEHCQHLNFFGYEASNLDKHAIFVSVYGSMMRHWVKAETY